MVTVKAPVRPRIYIIVDQGMIWEAYSDIELELIIKNVDRQWIRHLRAIVDSKKIDEIKELADTLEYEGVTMTGLLKEQNKQLKVRSLLPRKIKTGH